MPDNEVTFNINRKINWNKKAYKENNKEEFLFKVFTDKYWKNSFNFSSIDGNDGVKGSISSKDIKAFVSRQDVQKKGITEEDVIKFFNKVIEQNPTGIENSQETVNQYKDESGKEIMTDELKNMFGLEAKSFKVENVKNDDGTVKQGLEVFDLNGDNKIDDTEIANINSSMNIKDGKANVSNLKFYLENIEKQSGASADKIISKNEKQKLYDNISAAKKKKAHSDMQAVTEENGKPVLTDEIKTLYQKSDEINISDIVDESGKVKNGMEIFDLNNDGKIDEVEKQYYTKGGKFNDGDGGGITLAELMNVVQNIDKYGNLGKALADSKIYTSDKVQLYQCIQGAYNLTKDLEKFPVDIRDKYIDALNDISFSKHRERYANGMHSGNNITLNVAGANADAVENYLIHELTHQVLQMNAPKMNYMQQEVETFYMEYKLHQLKSQESGYMDRNFPRSGTIRIDKSYFDYIDNLKEEHPEWSERDVAVEAFIANHYDEYKDIYASYNMTPEDLRNSEFYPMGGIFSDDSVYLAQADKNEKSTDY